MKFQSVKALPAACLRPAERALRQLFANVPAFRLLSRPMAGLVQVDEFRRAAAILRTVDKPRSWPALAINRTDLNDFRSNATLLTRTRPIGRRRGLVRTIVGRCFAGNHSYDSFAVDIRIDPDRRRRSMFETAMAGPLSRMPAPARSVNCASGRTNGFDSGGPGRWRDRRDIDRTRSTLESTATGMCGRRAAAMLGCGRRGQQPQHHDRSCESAKKGQNGGEHRPLLTQGE